MTSSNVKDGRHERRALKTQRVLKLHRPLRNSSADFQRHPEIPQSVASINLKVNEDFRFRCLDKAWAVPRPDAFKSRSLQLRIGALTPELREKAIVQP